MPKFEITGPDGRKFEVNGPEGSNSEQAIQYIQQTYYTAAEPVAEPEAVTPEQPKPETTVLGQTAELFKGLVPGAIGLVEQAAIGASALLPEETEKAARKTIEEYATAAKKPFEAAPGYEETVARKLSEAVGSTIPFLAAGPLGLVGRAAAVGLGVGAGAGEARTRAEQTGATEGERAGATAFGVIPGAFEVFAPFKILGRLGTETVDTGVALVRRALVAGGEEAAQEAASGFAQNLIAKGVYKPEQALIEGLGEQAAYGGATGAIVQGLLDLAIGRRAYKARQAEFEKSPEGAQSAALLQQAQDYNRYQELKLKAEGRPAEKTMTDDGEEVVTPAVEKQFLSLAERDEYQRLKKQFEPTAEQGAQDETRQTGEPVTTAVDGGAEPSVPVPDGVDETAAGTVLAEREGVGSDRGLPSGAGVGEGAVDTAVKPGKAIWKSAEYDFPVEVISAEPELGPNGVRYSKVIFNGQETFVPTDQLVQKPAEETKAAPAPEDTAVGALPVEEVAKKGDAFTSPWLSATGEIVPTSGDHIAVFGEGDKGYSDYMNRTGAVRSGFFVDPEENAFVAMLHVAPGQKLTPAQVNTVETLAKEADRPVKIMYGEAAGLVNPEYKEITLEQLKEKSAPAKETKAAPTTEAVEETETTEVEPARPPAIYGRGDANKVKEIGTRLTNDVQAGEVFDSGESNVFFVVGNDVFQPRTKEDFNSLADELFEYAEYYSIPKKKTARATEEAKVEPTAFDFNKFVPQEDDKAVGRLAQIQEGKKKAYAPYKTLVDQLNNTANKIVDFLTARGVNVDKLADLRSAPQEVQDAIKLLNALGAEARNVGRDVYNQERNYATAKRTESDTAVEEAKRRADVANQRMAESVSKTLASAENFLQNPEGGTGEIVFSKTLQAEAGAKGLKAGSVQAIVEDMVQNYDNLPFIKVVQNVRELPPRIQAQIEREGVTPKGMYDPQTAAVYLVADHLSSANDVIKTAIHEIVGHFGMRAVLGDRYTRVMNEIYNGNKEVREAAQQKMTDNEGMTQEVATEEVLAEMAENSLAEYIAKKRLNIPKPLRQLIQVFRRVIKAFGGKMNLVSDTDIMELIANSHRFTMGKKLTTDRFTEGVAKDQPLAAGVAPEVLKSIVREDARLSDKRIKDLYSTWAYVGEDADTKAYIGFVRPSEFLEATTTPKELAYMREREFTQLDRTKIAEEVQPIFLQIEQESKEYGAPLNARGTIIGHEGRHRMMALQAAGVQEVPVVFINGYNGQRVRNAEPIKRADFDGQSWGDVGQGRGFTAYNLIPISYKYRSQIKGTFGGDAGVVFSKKEKPGAKGISNAFEPAGPVRVNPGARPSMDDFSSLRKSWESVKGRFNLKSILELPPTARQTLYKILTLRMLNDIAGKDLPQMRRAIGVVEKMVSMRNNIQREGSDILDKIQKVNKTADGRNKIKLMGELQVQATTLGIDPDPKSKYHQPNKVLTDAWNALGPEVQQIYKEMRGFYVTQHEGMLNDMIERATRNVQDPKAAAALRKEILDEFGLDKVKGPYFPLRRYGQYWFQVRSPDGKPENSEFYMFESYKDRNHWMEERRKELVAQGRGADLRFGDQLRGDNSLHAATAAMPVMKKIDKMVDDAAAKFADPKRSAKAMEDLKDSLKQLQYVMLPGNNIRKMFLHRKGVQGASVDAVRSFSQSVINLSYQRSRAKYSEDFYLNIDNGFAMLEDKNTPQDAILNDMMIELDSRADHILGVEPTTPANKISNGLTQFSFLYLLTAPASAAVNIFGMTAVGIPYVGAKYGYGKTTAAVMKYAGKYLGTAPKISEGNTVFPTLDKSVSLDDVQKAAYNTFLHDNAIDVSLTQDIMGLSQAPFEEYSAAKNKVVRGLSALFHHSERFNREILNMAAFDLAYEANVKKGMSPGIDGDAFKAAIEEAKDMSNMSLGDFTRASKPPVLTGPVTRVAFQFKQYSLLMTYNLLRNTMIGFNPFRENITPEQKAEAQEARRRMYGVIGITSLYAGAQGLPIFTAVSMLVEAMHALYSDDDEPEEEFDFKNWLYGYLEDTVGGVAASSIMRGVISQGTNIALSERMSLDLKDLWLRDSGYQKTAEDAVKEQALQLLGPSFSLFLNAAKAKDLLDNYQPDRALETILPTFARSLAVSARYAREGEATTRKGVSLDSDISYGDLFVKALGFTPEDIMAKQKAMIDRKKIQNKIEHRRELLLTGLFQAHMFGDIDGRDRAIEKIQAFNAAYPEIAIDLTKDAAQSIKRRMKALTEDEVFGGVKPKLGARLGEAVRTPGE